MNVLFLLPDFVFPADRGLRVRSLSQLRVLASIDWVENITVLSLAEKQVSVEQIRGLENTTPKVRAVPAVIQPVHMRRSPKHLPRLLRLRVAGVPYLIGKYDTRLMRALVEHHLTAAHYELVYVGAIGMAAYLPSVRRLAPDALVVLEEHNVEWEIFERLAPTYRFPFRVVAAQEARALRRYERRALQTVDAVIAISEADARALERLSGVAPVVVPTYVERGAPRTETIDAPALAYTGLLAWQPNAHGLDWFCTEVWPRVRERVPAATLTIAGPGLRKGPDGSLAVPPAWVAPGISTVGYVDDLEDLYRKSVAMVAPIIGGSGVRMKLLESMRSGMPTVTTADGAAGLDVEDGREMLIADRPAEFADRVARILTDRDLRGRVRAAGYAYIDSHHSMAAARARVEAAIASARVASARRGH
ncbi:MAG: glycosyltransferase family 4 protein [Polyangiaceae bacterium]|nr:glycosyltransferase family 4 protein [Polyangiaceae bacterium]